MKPSVRFSLLLVVTICLVNLSAERVSVHDDSISAGESVTWAANDTFVLMERVFVDSGAVLTIGEGAVVMAKYFDAAATPTEDPAQLIVARNAKIIANGTKASPIIFTSELDPLNYAYSQLVYRAHGVWGGITILGNAPTNSGAMEHYRAADKGQSDPRAKYGGTASEDSSGELSYISIRFAGTDINEPEGYEDQIDDDLLELAGLTLAGVGSKTNIHHIEVFQSADDGVKIFGGTVNAKYLASIFSLDNQFNLDQGYRGKGQFWFSYRRLMKKEGINELLNEGAHSYMVRNLGGVGTPAAFTQPTLSHLSFFNDASGQTISFAESAGGFLFNSLIYQSGNVEIVPSSATRWRNNELRIAYNLFAENVGQADPDWSLFTAGSGTLDSVLKPPENDLSAKMTNIVLKPKNSTPLDQPPYELAFRSIDSLTWVNIFPPDSMGDAEFFDAACWKGAFDPRIDSIWLVGWSALDGYGFLSEHNVKLIDSCYTGKLPIRMRYVSNSLFSGLNLRVSHSTLNLSFALPSEQIVSVNLYSVNGRFAKKLYHKSLSTGSQNLHLPLQGVAKGFYIVKIQADAHTIVKTVPFMR
ncbi:MAG: T9SS type A sorting domain-containing protein [Chitinivibrionales bacterium]|nr:T9SS type A sorting domain-containing protein [Chitinivibrionales bacterium]